MALTSTTLSAGVPAGATSLLVAATTGFLPGRLIQVDSETFLQTGAAVGYLIPVAGGKRGSASVAHNAGALVVVGEGSDFPVSTPIRLYSYGAAGAITPEPGLHRLLAASAAAMTLVAPRADQDKVELTILACAAQAYTVTLGSGYFNGATHDTATFGGAIGDVLRLVASGGSWMVVVAKNVTLS